MKNMYFHVHIHILYCRRQIRKKDLAAFKNIAISGKLNEDHSQVIVVTQTE